MIYFADNVNFKEKNFPALYDFIKKNKLTCYYDSEVYKVNIDTYEAKYESSVLVAEMYRGFKLFELYRDELMNRLFTSEYVDREIGNDDSELLDFVLQTNSMLITVCRNEAIYWVDHWQQLNKASIDIAIGFGGNNIRTNSFLKVLDRNGIPTFVVEHFFTGNDFYLERRSSSITNNSLLRKCNYKNDFSFYKKIQNIKNKNVVQPSYKNYELTDYILILAQVRNDYSIISKTNIRHNSVFFYKDLIMHLLKISDKTIVVKFHPYETLKVDLKVLSKTLISEFVNRLNEREQKRILLAENENVYSLIDQASSIITLNSQSGIEATLRYKKVICFGNPFYGRHGFTYDLESINELTEEVLNQKITIKEYDTFLKYLSSCFDSLVGIEEEYKVARLFSNFIKYNTKAGVVENSAANLNALTSPQNKISTEGKKVQQHKCFLYRQYRKLRKLVLHPRKYFADSKLNKLIKGE